MYCGNFLELNTNLSSEQNQMPLPKLLAHQQVLPDRIKGRIVCLHFRKLISTGGFQRSRLPWDGARKTRSSFLDPQIQSHEVTEILHYQTLKVVKKEQYTMQVKP